MTSLTAAQATLDTLARTLWAEARGEGVAGMEAVACVILHRAAHPRWWGHDVTSVCLARNQFSCWLPEPVGQLARIRAVTTADPLFRAARSVAADALMGKLVDQTGGADSYANLSTSNPAWAHGRTPSAVIGHHTFFRLELPAPSGATSEKSAQVPQPAHVAPHPSAHLVETPIQGQPGGDALDARFDPGG